MKHIKTIILLLLLVFCSGCEVEYNLSFKELNFSENINVYSDSSKVNNEIYDGLSMKTIYDNKSKDYYPAFSNSSDYDYFDMGKQDGFNDYYNISILDSQNKYGINANYIFNPDNYYSSYAVHMCNKELVLSSSENIYNISLSNNYTCFKYYDLLDKITVNFTTDLTVSYCDADIVKDNTYTWVITRDNYKVKTINIYLLKDDKYYNTVDDYEDNKKDDANTVNENYTTKQKVLIGLGILLIFTTLLFIIIKIKKVTL